MALTYKSVDSKTLHFTTGHPDLTVKNASTICRSGKNMNVSIGNVQRLVITSVIRVLQVDKTRPKIDIAILAVLAGLSRLSFIKV